MNGVGLKDKAFILGKLKHITSLSVQANELGAFEVQAIARIPSLTSLDIFNNHLGIEGAKAVAEITTLTHLSIGCNDIKEEGAAYLINLYNLRELQTSENLSTATLNTLLFNLPNLERIKINNYNKNVDQTVIISLTNHESINAVKMTFHVQDESSIDLLFSMTQLRSLDLVLFPNVNHLPSFNALDNLEVLDLECDEISSENLRSIGLLPTLGELCLAMCKINPDQMYNLLVGFIYNSNPNVALNLNKLLLVNNDLNIESLSFLAHGITLLPQKFSNLTVLGISGHKLGPEATVLFANMLGKNIGSALPNLERLYLGSNNMRQASVALLEVFASCSNISTLSLGSNNIPLNLPKFWEVLARFLGLKILNLQANDAKNGIGLMEAKNLNNSLCFPSLIQLDIQPYYNDPHNMTGFAQALSVFPVLKELSISRGFSAQDINAAVAERLNLQAQGYCLKKMNCFLTSFNVRDLKLLAAVNINLRHSLFNDSVPENTVEAITHEANPLTRINNGILVADFPAAFTPPRLYELCLFKVSGYGLNKASLPYEIKQELKPKIPSLETLCLFKLKFMREKSELKRAPQIPSLKTLCFFKLDLMQETKELKREQLEQKAGRC